MTVIAQLCFLGTHKIVQMPLDYKRNANWQLAP